MRLSALLVAVAIIGLSAPGCRDQANPVLPPVGNESPGLSGAKPGADAAVLVVDSATDPIPDRVSDLPPPDGRQIACSLLKQDCPTGQLPLQACYPVGTLGRCLPAGSAAPLVGCTVVNDCEKGTVCVQDEQTGTGVCWALCNRSDTSTCGKNNVCLELHGFADVGYCRES